LIRIVTVIGWSIKMEREISSSITLIPQKKEGTEDFDNECKIFLGLAIAQYL